MLKKIVTFTNIGLISIIPLLLADMLVKYADYRYSVKLAPPTAAKIQREKRTKREPFQKYAELIEKNLFNPAKREESRIAKPKTTEQSTKKGSGRRAEEAGIKLRGIVLTSTGEGIAFIEDLKTGKQEYHKVGEEIKGYIISEITSDKIVLTKNDKKIELALVFRTEKPPRRGTSRYHRSTRFTRPKITRETAYSTSGRPPKIEKIGASTYVVSKEDLEESIKDLNRFLTQARITPYFKSGKPAGFRISHIAKSGVFERLGFRNGDIIKGVNGEAITSPEQVFNLYNQLTSEGQISIEVERAGRIITHTYQIK